MRHLSLLLLLTVLLSTSLIACGEAQSDGDPTPGTTAPEPSEPPCEDEALDRCSGECLDLSRDPNNCGSCGNACGEGGGCRFGECFCMGSGNWCGPGVCVPQFTYLDHCGACNNACGAGEQCIDRACVASQRTEAIEVLRFTNEARARGESCGGVPYPPVNPLSFNQQLEDAAQAHAEDMARRGYFEHNTPDGVTPTQRMRAAGYQGRMTGENIAQGYRDAESVVAGWISSPGHCRNLMDADFTELGVGYYPDGNQWVQNFGAR